MKYLENQLRGEINVTVYDIMLLASKTYLDDKYDWIKSDEVRCKELKLTPFELNLYSIYCNYFRLEFIQNEDFYRINGKFKNCMNKMEWTTAILHLAYIPDIQEDILKSICAEFIKQLSAKYNIPLTFGAITKIIPSICIHVHFTKDIINTLQKLYYTKDRKAYNVRMRHNA
jgi:hypothetical protein